MDALLTEINLLKDENQSLKNELEDVKHKLNTYQSNSKKYYENNKEKIIDKVKEYKEKTQYKYIPTDEQKKKWARTAYLNKKAKLEKAKLENQNI